MGNGQSAQIEQASFSKPKVTLLFLGTDPDDLNEIITILKKLDLSNWADAKKIRKEQKLQLKNNPNIFYAYDRLFEVKICDDEGGYDIAIYAYDQNLDVDTITKYLNGCYARTHNSLNSTYKKNIILAYHKSSMDNIPEIKIKDKELKPIHNRIRRVIVYSCLSNKHSFGHVIRAVIGIFDGKM
jgi:hypothetical protein